MKSHADNLGQAGNPINTRSLVSQVLLGLDEEYNPVVAMAQSRTGMTWSELQGELLAFEKRLEHQNSQKSNSLLSHNDSANMVNKSGNSSNSPRPQHMVNTNRQQPNNSQRGTGSRNFVGRGRGRVNITQFYHPISLIGCHLLLS